jgi:hypothetical protein
MPRKLEWMKSQKPSRYAPRRAESHSPGIEVGDVLRDHTVATPVVVPGAVAAVRS